MLVPMLTGFDDEELAEDLPLRERQEREIALGHSLTNAEHELAREALALGRTFEAAGLTFDPLTFVALRIVDGSRDEHVDPIDCLNVLLAFGFLERSVALATGLLDEAA
jgi:hypothetical protein